MARLIKTNSLFKEGELFNKIMRSRFNSNQNILSVITGGTGSSKSYQDLRRAELWYAFRFKEPFPESHICFSLGELMKIMVTKMQDKKLRKGDIFILEESGVNLGSLDFQQKIVKMFNYTLQSFRSLNTGVFFNLPHLSMLSKQARMLVHFHFITESIDQETNTSKSRLFYRQVNQHTGKIYPKNIRISFHGRKICIKRFVYNLPSPELRKIYEAKKFRFVSENAIEYTNYLNEIDKEAMRATAREELTDRQMEVYELNQEGYNQREIGEMKGLNQKTVWEYLQAIKKKGYGVKNTNSYVENGGLGGIKHIPIPV